MLTLSNSLLNSDQHHRGLAGKTRMSDAVISPPQQEVVWLRVLGELELWMAKNSGTQWEENIPVLILLGHRICWKPLQAVNLLPRKIHKHVKAHRLFQGLHTPPGAWRSVGPHVKCLPRKVPGFLMWRLCPLAPGISQVAHGRAGSRQKERVEHVPWGWLSYTEHKWPSSP